MLLRTVTIVRDNNHTTQSMCIRTAMVTNRLLLYAVRYFGGNVDDKKSCIRKVKYLRGLNKEIDIFFFFFFPVARFEFYFFNS